MATSSDPERPTLSTPESVAIPPRPTDGRPKEAPRGRGTDPPRTWVAIAIKLGVLGAVLHGLAPASPPPPESLARPLLHGLAWCCWAGAFAAGAAISARAGVAISAGKRSAARGTLGAALIGPAPATAVDTAHAHNEAPAWTLALGTLGVVVLGALLRQTTGAVDPAADAVLRETLERFPVWGIAVVFVLLPALGEEAFFRGAVLRLAALRVGAGIAAIGSALVFAAVHPAHPISALTLGLALAVLALVAGRTREAIFAHAAHNALGLAGLASAIGPAEWPLLARVGAAALVATSAWALLRLRPFRPYPPGWRRRNSAA